MGAGRYLRERARDESGVALAFALLVITVLTITVTTMIGMTGGSTRQASVLSARQQARSLGEAGLNSAVSILAANYPGTVAYPGEPNLLPPRSTAHDGGSCVPPVHRCVTWSGTLAGPLLTASPWRWEWRITATGTVRNPSGPNAPPVTRRVKMVVPVVMVPVTPSSASGPLNFLYSGTHMWFTNSVHVKAQTYVVGDLHLESTAVIDGEADKVGVGRDLYLRNPQNQIGLTLPGDPRIDQIHVVGQCSSKAIPALHACGPTTAGWETDKIFATVADNVIPSGFLAYTPSITCCSPVNGTIDPAPSSGSSNMGFWYLNAEVGPLSPCTTKTGTPPVFDTASGVADGTINWSATPAVAINLTPPVSYSCKVMVGDVLLGELSWDQSAQLLTVKGTIFIDGSVYIQPTGIARYSGVASIIASGTFGMKNSTICAKHAGYTGACDFTGASPWDPDLAALIIVSDGSAAGSGAQGQSDSGGERIRIGEAMELKGSGFQGALIANKTIRVETSGGAAAMQGPMISVYNEVWAGQSNDLIFPPILFAPSGGGGIIGELPKPQLLRPVYSQ